MSRFVVFGNPISHSLSPQLQTLFAQQFGLVIDYQKHYVPLDQFRETVDVFRANAGVGANITIPFKTQAFDYADQHTERATRVRAVNTFIFKNTICIGDNTDGVGLIRDLKNNLNAPIENQTILILGAGGATRGILGEIIREKPHKILIHNRTLENAKQLALNFNSHFEIDIYSDETNIDLVINATNLDFQHEFDLNFDLSQTICYDLNYGQRHQTFLTWAKKNKARFVADGLGMLVEQGAESFYQWIGKRPDTKGVIELFRNRARSAAE
ncbi:MAG: shikimate dehydrogenase [Gammaproteobacteria bacterium RIFCSPHIGHO2_12_FULL_40_19]|nr:MAG: shikimate dehydrogenase [Gammaproteobacteria bacterium RIFCSPHIGHO2_12_FULL_40_19]